MFFVDLTASQPASQIVTQLLNAETVDPRSVIFLSARHSHTKKAVGQTAARVLAVHL